MSTHRFVRGAIVAWAALGFAGCGDEDAPKGAPPPTATRADRAPRSADSHAGAGKAASKSGASKLPTPPLAPGTVRRWYDNLHEGQKVGTFDVTWAPSTWNGKATIRDVTTMRQATGRDMAGTIDVFSTETLSTTERGEDGTLWWQRSVTTLANGREDVAETTWTGNGYDTVISSQGTEQRFRVDAAEPTSLDVESAVGPRLVRGEIGLGSKLKLRYAAAAKKRVVEFDVEVVAMEDGPAEEGTVHCWKVVETDPETKSTSTWWIDPTGAVARQKSLSDEVRRVSKSKAAENPTEPPSFPITAPANPSIERIFTADRTLVDVKLRGDPDRPLPEFPTSPFSRVLSVEGSDAAGWTVHMQMDAYDVPKDATATIPVKDPAFADDLAPTILMPCGHPDVLGKAKQIVGTERHALAAVRRIADFVFTLQKQSPEIADTTAVEILEEGRGDCSEHAVLFVALCRAAGIPARRCSGFVSVGELWGGHAFAEVWVGGWMGVDPTTNDVGTAGRYIFFGYPDSPESHAGVVSARAAGRMRFDVTSITEADETFDLRSPSSWRFVDAEAKVASHRLAGIEARDWPDDWTVRLRGAAAATVTGPGFTAEIQANADQGYRGEHYLRLLTPRGKATTFAGAPARVMRAGADRRTVVVGSRRRRVAISVIATGGGADLDKVLAQLEKVFAKTFAPSPHGW